MNSRTSHFPIRSRFFGQLAMIALFLITSFATKLHGQDFEGKKITEVSIRYRGAKTADEARLKELMSSKAGSKYRMESLDNDIKALFESGLVDDVKILAEPVESGVRVIVDVLTRPEIDGVGFVGNTVFSDVKLAKATKLKAGGLLSEARIFEAQHNIEKFYRGSGYADVAVRHQMQKTDKEGFSDLIFIIEEGNITIREGEKSNVKSPPKP